MSFILKWTWEHKINVTILSFNNSFDYLWDDHVQKEKKNAINVKGNRKFEAL